MNEQTKCPYCSTLSLGARGEIKSRYLPLILKHAKGEQS